MAEVFYWGMKHGKILLSTSVILIGMILTIIFLRLEENKDSRSKKRKVLVVAALIILTSVLLLFLMQSEMMLGVLLTIIIVLYVMLSYVLLARIGNQKDSTTEILRFDDKKLKTIREVLTYAATALAFISWFTTAKGMEDVVFGGWMAYPASFAVQAMLVVLSFWMLRFLVNVSSLSWPRYIQRAVSCSLILVLCGFMVMSSMFSYAFIATNAYEKMQTDNSEAITRTYLTQMVNEMTKENESRGAALYNSMTEASGDLADAISAKEKTAAVAVANDLEGKLSFINSIDNAETIQIERDFSDIDERSKTVSDNVKLNLQSAKDTLIFVNESLTRVLEDITDCIKEITRVYENLQNDTETDIQDYNSILMWYNKLYGNGGDTTGSTLDNLKSTIDDISDGGYIVVREHKTRAIHNADSMIAIVHQMEEILTDAKKIIDENNLTQSIIVSSGTGSAQTISSVEDILSKVNAIAAFSGNNDTSDEAETEIDDLIQTIGSWVNDKNLEPKTMEAIQKFCENLKEYKKYIQLKQTMDTFLSERMSVIYVVDDNQRKVGNVIYTMEDEWRAERSGDFYTVESALTMFPEDITGESTFDTDQKIEDTIQVQRKLLAGLSDIERALTYFDKEYEGYRKMAVFSLVIAVFFDLGAFFIGSFIFLTELFDNSMNKAKEGSEKEQEKERKEEQAEEQKEEEKSANGNPDTGI